ncbi:alpha/beta fold hydrolase [Compostimonas suwonensis]|uniref:Pimeloyl-ACP methyl ester carboxylesterase n=1 Tax=Compostimonas suwonensis TaxID=1048394 RepID=A0A2M9C3R9_9MICO|nr:alpha/beta hydrolase [Compostimonas suwonensis]PJJ65175.1 pimeloyl-ACP methyl ester carboxylesterase [Compostimonas suwonensis]
MATPTVLLVHGAFADGSSWSKVITHLQAAGIPVRTVVNPLRGVTFDGEYVASVVAQTEGDVVLVGHSYGGPVITYAGSTAENVKGLVYVASFGLDKGMTVQESTAGFPDSKLGAALRPHAYPGSDLPEFTIDEEQYREAFAADVTDEEAAVGAVNQRPVAAVAFGEPLAVEPAWKRVPSWWVLSGADNAINPDSQRAAVARLGATVTEIEGGSHSIAVSHSAEVAEVIVSAVRSLS